MLLDSIKAFCRKHVGSPSRGVCNRFENDNPADPPVEEVVGVEADPEKGNERIVPPGKNNQRDHVNNRKMTCPAPNFCDQSRSILPLKVEKAAIDDIACQIKEKED